MVKVKNKSYREFLDDGSITPVSREEVVCALGNVCGSYVKEGRALLLLLYLTGARPVEVVSLRGHDVRREGRHVVVQLRGSKRGLSRPVFLKWSDVFVKEVLSFSSSVFPDLFLFRHFRSEYVRRVVKKDGRVFDRAEPAAKVRYYVSSWFDGVRDGGLTTYFLRHSRFSQLSAAGVSSEDLRVLKGSRTLASVVPYVHLSSRKGKSLASKIR